LPSSEVIISDAYPNPLFSDEEMYVNIQNNFDIYNLRIEFYDILGELVSSYSFDSSISQGNSSVSVPISKHLIISGMYFLVFLDEDDMISIKKIIFIK